MHRYQFLGSDVWATDRSSGSVVICETVAPVSAIPSEIAKLLCKFDKGTQLYIEVSSFLLGSVAICGVRSL
jgi:hypothetical protein